MTSIQNGTPGLNLGELFGKGLNSVSDRGKALQGKMTELLAKEQVSPEDMLAVQFEMGQYNALMESLSSVTKGLTDTLKSVAQRAG